MAHAVRDSFTLSIWRAHTFWRSASPVIRSAIYNLGCGGDGYTVREVIDTARQVTGREIPVSVALRRPVILQC